MSRAKPIAKVIKDREPSQSDLHLPTVLHALSDEIRLDIVKQIARNGDKACGTFGVDLPKSTLSHHFRVLREAGVLSVRRQGKELMNAIRQEDLSVRFPGLLEAVLGDVPPGKVRRRNKINATMTLD